MRSGPRSSRNAGLGNIRVKLTTGMRLVMRVNGKLDRKTRKIPGTRAGASEAGDERLPAGRGEVEGCLLEHPAVQQAAVVGVADANGLVKPHAWIVCRERRDGLADELKAFVRGRLEPYKCPREVTFVDALPTTHLGKVDRGRLRSSS